MGFIQGNHRQQSVLFPPCFDDYVGEDNPVRFIDAFVDKLEMENLGYLRPQPEKMGRPGYDPRVLLKLYIYGYLNQIKSSRKLAKETVRNIEVIWLVEGLKPDFRTIADFRKQNKKGISQTFREFTLLCKSLDLFGMELVGIDGSKFKAVNSPTKNYSKARLKSLLKLVEERIIKYLDLLDKQDSQEGGQNEETKESLQGKIEKLQEKKEKLEEIGVRLDQSEDGQISLTDPDARRMKSGQKKVVGYNVQTGVDEKHKLIVAAKATQDRADNTQLAEMSLEIKKNLGVEALEIVADKGYYDFDRIVECIENGIQPRIPIQKRSRKDPESFSKDHFVYDEKLDVYHCPVGEMLMPPKTTRNPDKKFTIYKTKKCLQCEFLTQCTTSKQGRSIHRYKNEHIIDKWKKWLKKEGTKQAERKAIVEHPFGIMKTSMQFTGFLTKGLKNVQTELDLTVLAFNMKRVFNIMGVRDLIQAV